MNLFDYVPPLRYPETPGFKEGDTSRKAADAIAPCARILRDKCMERLAMRPATADEVAIWMGASAFSIRPRITELFQLGKIADTGERRANDSGRKAKVWRVA